MLHFFSFFKKIARIFTRENIHKLLIIILLLIIVGSFGLVHFEENLNFFDALWWSVVTMTTVGYGDISPATEGGRIIAVIVMVTGIGLLGVFTAAVASIFVENRFMENRGMTSTHAKDHFIICGWSYRGPEIVAELRADPKCGKITIALIADIPEKPMDDPMLHFIHGDVTAATLKKANLSKANGVIVLADDRLDAYSRDAKTILTTMTVKTEAPDIYTCVELTDPQNMEHCRMAKADEIITVGELSTNLIVQAALDHGITRLISELVSKRYGNDLYKIKMPPYLIEKSFLDAVVMLKKDHEILCIGVEDKEGKSFIANPDNELKLKESDRLIVISEDRPAI